MNTVSVGKAKISVVVRGCAGCGTEHAEGWVHARTVPVTIGGRRLFVEVSCCAACAKEGTPLLQRTEEA